MCFTYSQLQIYFCPILYFTMGLYLFNIQKKNAKNLEKKINQEASSLAQYFHGPLLVGPGDNFAFSSVRVRGPVGTSKTGWLGDPYPRGQEGAPGNVHFPSKAQIPLLALLHYIFNYDLLVWVKKEYNFALRDMPGLCFKHFQVLWKLQGS